MAFARFIADYSMESEIMPDGFELARLRKNT